MSSLALVVGGGTLLVASCLVLLLMVIRVIQPSMLFSLGAYGASLAGLVLGLFGAVQYTRRGRGVSRG